MTKTTEEEHDKLPIRYFSYFFIFPYFYRKVVLKFGTKRMFFHKNFQNIARHDITTLKILRYHLS